MAWFDRLLRWLLPLVPRFIVRSVSSRYIAGEQREEALRTVCNLNQEGAMATLDVLGEEVRDVAGVEAAVAEYSTALAEVHQRQLDANISVKLTQLGLRIDESLCCDALTRIVRRAAEIDSFVRIDMEDHSTVDATFRIYRQLRLRHSNLGIVLQSRLRRTLGDLSGLLPLHPNVRLCKGIYREPRSRAWLDPEIVRQSYVSALERLLSHGCYVGIATHDERLIWAAMDLIERMAVPPDRYEFQMLLGVDPELRRIILAAGHRLRVYTPYGFDWYHYSLRRLRENPTIARYVLRALLSNRAVSSDPRGSPPGTSPRQARSARPRQV